VKEAKFRMKEVKFRSKYADRNPAKLTYNHHSTDRIYARVTPEIKTKIRDYAYINEMSQCEVVNKALETFFETEVE